MVSSWLPVFVKELLNLTVKIDLKISHDSYSAWRGDMILATALACWRGKNRTPRQPEIKELKRILGGSLILAI